MDSISAGSRSARGAAVSSGREPGNKVPGRKSARLFAELFRDVDPAQRLKVLELGRAQPETVDFFSRFKCRLQFADIYSSCELLQEQAKLSEAERWEVVLYFRTLQQER